MDEFYDDDQREYERYDLNHDINQRVRRNAEFRRTLENDYDMEREIHTNGELDGEDETGMNNTNDESNDDYQPDLYNNNYERENDTNGELDGEVTGMKNMNDESDDDYQRDLDDNDLSHDLNRRVRRNVELMRTLEKDLIEENKRIKQKARLMAESIYWTNRHNAEKDEMYREMMAVDIIQYFHPDTTNDEKETTIAKFRNNYNFGDNFHFGIFGKPEHNDSIYVRGHDDGLRVTYYGTGVFLCRFCNNRPEQVDVLSDRCNGDWSVPVCKSCRITDYV